MLIIHVAITIYIGCIEQTHVDGTVMKHVAFERSDIIEIDVSIDKDIEVSFIVIELELMSVSI